MTNRFLTTDVWGRIKMLARERGRRSVAVPFIGSGAHKQLALRRGDLLVARCDEPTVKAGITDPREIIQYLKRGVAVRSVAKLHAKVFVFKQTAVIGSTNVSHSSEVDLIEAAVETSDPRVVQDARRFVETLRGKKVGLRAAKRLCDIYKTQPGPLEETVPSVTSKRTVKKPVGLPTFAKLNLRKWKKALAKRNIRLDSPRVLEFRNVEYVFTGQFQSGFQRDCHERVEKRGGRATERVTRHTQVLVIGALGNVNYAWKTYGKKIDKADALRRDSRDKLPLIITEDTWLRCL